MYISLSLALLLLSPLTAGLPLQEPLLDSSSTSCTIILPTSYQQIAQSTPAKAYPQNRIFNVKHAAGGANADVDTLVRFTGIPPGSYGCQLAMSFTFEYEINSTGNALLNVYALPGTVKPTDTYNDYFPKGGRGSPVGGTLFTTTTITGQRAVLNSEVCRPELSFLFEIASDSSAGSVAFRDAGDNLTGIGGFYLTYNC